jgi:hypothetical protein
MPELPSAILLELGQHFRADVDLKPTGTVQDANQDVRHLFREVLVVILSVGFQSFRYLAMDQRQHCRNLVLSRVPIRWARNIPAVGLIDGVDLGSQR